jgi:hypothetical protein
MGVITRSSFESLRTLRPDGSPAATDGNGNIPATSIAKKTTEQIILLILDISFTPRSCGTAQKPVSLSFPMAYDAKIGPRDALLSDFITSIRSLAWMQTAATPVRSHHDRWVLARDTLRSPGLATVDFAGAQLFSHR